MPIKTKPTGNIPFLLNYQPYELPLGVEPIDDINDMISFNFEIPEKPSVINYNIGSLREDFVNLVIKNITRETVLQVFLDYDNQTFNIRERDTGIEPRPVVTLAEQANLPVNAPVVAPEIAADFQTSQGGFTLTPQPPSAPSLQPFPAIPTKYTKTDHIKISPIDNISTQPITQPPRQIINASIGNDIFGQPTTQPPQQITPEITNLSQIQLDEIGQRLRNEADLRSQPAIQRERRIESTPVILRGGDIATFVIKYNKAHLNSYTDYTAFLTLIRVRIQNMFDGKLCTKNVAVKLLSKERFQPKITVV